MQPEDVTYNTNLMMGESYFQTIANLVPDMLWRNDATGNRTWYNQRWLDYTGQTLEEAQGYGWLEAIHPDDRAQALANFQSAVDEHRPLRQEQRIRCTDGNYRWFLVQTHPVFDSNGQLLEWLGVATDIHDRQMAVEGLRESEGLLRALIEDLPGGAVFVVDRDLRYLLAQGEALSAAGFKSEDFVGRTIFEALPTALAVNYERYYRQALAGESFEHEHTSHNHTYITRGRPLRSTDGEVYAVLAVSYDITDRKQAEADRIRLIQEQAAREQERQRAEALAELDRAKTLFFSNISHEFRTPLTLLLAPLQDALSDPTLASIHRERLEFARRNGVRLLKLVNTLLDFSRIEAGRIEAIYEPTDLAQFTTDLASMFRSAIERAGMRLIVDCPPLPEPVYVDREMWEKIVLNLLSNALKFTFKGEITVSLHSDLHSQAILEIRDTGTGIAPEHLPHLFDRFYQVRGTQARAQEGSGIGLALVYELIRLHGGAIEVSSTVGQGTCFTITLPFKTDRLPPERIQATRTLTSTAHGVDPYIEEAERWLPIQGRGEWGVGNGEELSTPSSARVLVVDDNADMREYLTRILSEQVQVVAVADGTAALAAIQAQVPDLVLSDVMMPGLDGFSLLQTLRADPRTREIPIVLLSARAGEEAIVEGLEAGADDYLIKPFSTQELVSRVSAHLQMAQLRGEALHEARTIIRRKDELLSTISHELNTPLVSILGWTRLLRNSPPSPSVLTKALDTIERNATLQAALVQDLLDISRITAGKLRLNMQPVELKSVVETAIASLHHLTQEKEIDLIWQLITSHVQKDAVVVMGDRNRLQQVVSNLLTNAIKFTKETGSVTVELSIIDGENSSDTSYAQIRVIDTGIGISADFLPHVFERFRQAEGANTAKGLGLGLAIAQHLVELHNGTIQAQSAGVGQGATFIVRLPLLKTMEDAA